MHALVLHQVKQPLRWEQQADRVPEEGEVIVRLKAAALNRRDYWITQGKYPGIRTPAILGSDGAGVVQQAGAGVDEGLIGREVIINPGWDWGDRQAAQSDAFRILGLPDDGTLATEVRVAAEYLHDKPGHLDWHQSAALPLAGLTAYRAVFVQGNLQEGETVLVTGIGGGVATFALQMAKAAKARVLVTSSSDAKLQRAMELGADAGYNYRQPDWASKLRRQEGPIDLVIDSAGGEGYSALLDVAAAGGRIVNYGATAGPPPQLDLFRVFWKQLRLIGSTMGSPTDFRNMLQFVHKHQLVPAIDRIVPLADGNEALQRMAAAEQFGKLVLQID